jgi:hypothetical protein
MWELLKEVLVSMVWPVVGKFVENHSRVHYFYVVQLAELLYVSLLLCDNRCNLMYLNVWGFWLWFKFMS